MNRQQLLERTICQHIDEPPLAMYDLGVGPADGSKTEWLTLPDQYPEMLLYGCEPDPLRCRELEKVFPGPLFRVAIGAEPGRMRLHCDSRGKTAASALPLGGLDQVREVDVWTLDHFDAICNSPDRILLWMDIEGSELDAIRGGRELLASGRVRWINLEMGRWPHRQADRGWPDPVAITNELHARGFDLAQRYNVHRTHSDAIFVRE